MDEDQTAGINHLGLILDGNRRWAKANGQTTFEGHARGYENFKTIAKEAINLGIPVISTYIFSTENWSRSEEEVKFLMSLALKMAKKDVKELAKENIKVRFIGSKDRLSRQLIRAIDEAEDLTKNNTRGTIALCFNYGGKDEIVKAVKSIVDKKIKKDTITEETIEQNLYASDIPPVDMIIRTSGVHRTSGYMLWRSDYSELLFVDKLWPDFNKNDLNDAISEYKKRVRRFGK